MKRLQSELMDLMMDGPPGVAAFPDDDDLFCWAATISGVADTVYEGYSFKLRLEFSSEYPFRAPVVTFTDACFHPNVDNQGNICLDILKEKWSAAYNVKTVLLSIQNLLADPNNDSPLNGYAAALWANQKEYAVELKERCKLS
eukprot:CAMPEP_0201552770 /NCGR_PEP_ID=MMETSP0173_2-20130828/17719_1 /ASSEMBLY_ACC=CAM_ASM_000268 /TAXON_ID=218659 /ORGANISM="Vexillifera sp., Strain DIVA3 564/2" /LENGTH=142 /DNA_ID=CAMNT_0047963315 /DNA_START=49 /DNA_END=474 /DNA_ORIENTATION=+